MKQFTKIALGVSLLASTLASSMASAQEITGNVGLMSEYHFRGIIQNSTATANGGIDVESGNWSAGIWAADVEDGLEVDLYGGYGFELESGIGLSAGVTEYLYTGDFDSGYSEINLGASYGLFSLEYTLGEWDGVDCSPEDDDCTDGETESYTFVGLTVENEGFYATVGSFGGDFSGEYGEIGYGLEVATFDVGAAIVFSDNELDNDEAFYFTISKSFSL